MTKKQNVYNTEKFTFNGKRELEVEVW